MTIDIKPGTYTYTDQAGNPVLVEQGTAQSSSPGTYKVPEVKKGEVVEKIIVVKKDE